jgi:phosphoglucomutase
MVLSSSGWRTVFAPDGNEESTAERVRAEHLVLAGLASRVFAREVLARNGQVVLVGRDSRPTGAALCRVAIRVLLSEGLAPEFMDIAASPEIMASAAVREDVAGFFYVSASHNPIGHNGFKTGFEDGSVAGGEVSAAMVRSFRESAADRNAVRDIADVLGREHVPGEKEVMAASAEAKAAALEAYLRFANEVAAGPGERAQAAMETLARSIAAGAPGIVADLNGSARCVSIDERLLTSLGCRLRILNGRAGSIAHQIVPEGPGLEQCVRELELASGSSPEFLLGYVPDNDGDRGNLVIAEEPGHARPMGAQEVFALSAVSELCWLFHTGAVTPGVGRTAIVANGPTSMRMDAIARTLGVEMHRAEVGEANVVGLARELRAAGVTVRFLGEGSNGGNITHPSTVRDPIQTLFAVLKLLYAPGSNKSPSPAQLWLERAASMPVAAPGTAAGEPDLGSILRSLPHFTTTSAFSPDAVMQVRSQDHGGLKTRVEELWERAWDSNSGTDVVRRGLQTARDTLGIEGFRYENYEGTTCRPGKGNRRTGRGGFKIILTDAGDTPRAFLWMRGSGTEPVFRVMVDIEGDRPQVEQDLLALLRDLVATADAAN